MYCVVSALPLFSLATYGHGIFGGHIQENNVQMLNLRIHNFINRMQEKVSHLNDTPDVQFQELIKDIFTDTDKLPTFTASGIITDCL
jgi:hypothetical protein